MGRNGWQLKGRIIRHQLFTLVTLLGCVAPWITPRHFPIHRLQGTQEPMVMPWVVPKTDSPQFVQPLIYEESGEHQRAGQISQENSTISIEANALLNR